MKLRILRPCLPAVLSLFWFSVAVSAEPDDFESWLQKPIIDPQLPLNEVREFCEAHVPPMPQVSTVDEWERYAKQARQRVFDEVVFRGAAAKWRSAECRVEFLETIEGGPEYRIRKLRYEAVPGMWIPALLYEPKKLSGKVPVVLNVNGHDRKDGKAAGYKQTRCINQAKRGMLALNVEWLGMGQLQSEGNVHYRLNQLDLCGTSGLAPFYLSMSRGLDLLLAHKHADPDRVAVAGLSGGGWQTIFISSLDERVTLSDPVAGYSSFRTRARFPSDLGDSEQTPVDLAVAADYAQLTAMRAPRPTLLTFNLNDNCCFASPHALPPLMDAALPIFKLYDRADSLRWHVNEDPGTHNFEIDNRQTLYRMFQDFFYKDNADFSAAEIPCESELKSYDELLVELPADSETLHSLAVNVSESLPCSAVIPEDAVGLAVWRAQRRRELRRLLRVHDWNVQGSRQTESSISGGVAVSQWALNVGGRWTVPATVFEPGASRGTVLVIADEGRSTAAKQIAELVGEGNRVVTVDPFYFGESKIAQRDFLYALLVSAVGDRPLGIQSSQIVAITDWATEQFGQPVSLVATGERTSLIALAAAAQSDALASVTLHGSLTSLRQIIERNIAVNQQPEMFCFGLLEEFDIPQLIAIAGKDRVAATFAD
ncbi:hypothetical protein GC176_21215 [bacterium]|nr:hypothetical protein [bacterium]